MNKTEARLSFELSSLEQRIDSEYSTVERIDSLRQDLTKQYGQSPDTSLQAQMRHLATQVVLSSASQNDAGDDADDSSMTADQLKQVDVLTKYLLRNGITRPERSLLAGLGLNL